MGQEAIYRCLDCQTEFVSKEGGGFLFELFRCVHCDTTKTVKHERLGGSAEHTCSRCGGEMRSDLKPMCPQYHSRQNEEVEVLQLYD